MERKSSYVAFRNNIKFLTTIRNIGRILRRVLKDILLKYD